MRQIHWPSFWRGFADGFSLGPLWRFLKANSRKGDVGIIRRRREEFMPLIILSVTVLLVVAFLVASVVMEALK